MSEAWSMPWAAPVFTIPPHSWQGVRSVVMGFTPDPATLSAILPAPLEPREGSGLITMLTYPWGHPQRTHPFDEAVVLVPVRLGDLEANYVPYIYVTTDEALIAGREAAGWPKKIASITWERDGDQFHGSVTRWDTTILEVHGDFSAPPADGDLGAIVGGGGLPTLNYKLIPGPGSEIEVEEITSSQLEIAPSDVAMGTGRVTATSSEDDPVGDLIVASAGPIVALTSDNTIPLGEVVHRIDHRAVLAPAGAPA
jgi:acetoacetate decarboxylase